MGISPATLWSEFESLPMGVSKSPKFLSWWKYLGEEGQRLVMTALEERGGAIGDTKSEAFLGELFEECSRIRSENLFVSLGDFGGRKSRALIILKRALNIVSDRDIGLADRRYGSVSHLVVPLLLEGRIPANYTGDGVVSDPGSSQFSVWDSPRMSDEEVQAELELSEFSPTQDWPVLSRVSAPHDLPQVVLDDLARVVGDIQLAFQFAGSWHERVGITQRYRSTLLKMLRPIVGSFIDKLPRYQEIGADHLMTLTLVMWADAIVRSAHERSARILFKEINAFDRRVGLSGGRIDALEVVSIGGRDLGDKERKFLSYLARDRYTSVSYLHDRLTRLFGGDVRMVVNDFKFGVGDFPGKGDLVAPADCPQPSHVEQMQRYLTLIPLDLYLHHGQAHGRIWDSGGLQIEEARLAFHLPTYGSFDKSVRITNNERLEIFRSRFASRWVTAEKRSENRHLTNKVLSAIAREITDRADTHVNGKNGSDRGRRVHQSLELFETESLRSVVEKHRHYVDKHKIVEKVARPNGPVHLLHFDRLVQALDGGKLRHLSFDSFRGGRVECLNPEHSDEHPDMSVNLGRGGFHCFACGFSGLIAEESLTGEQLNLVRRESARGFDLDSIVIPDECHNLLAAAQRYMSGAFQGSPAENYLAKVRGLDPRIAFELGAGYGKEELILGLIDDEHGLDELAEHGLIGYSPNVKESSSLVRKLLDYGYSLEEIVRPRKVRKDGKEKEVSALPFTILRDRVTFPLMLEGRYTNFYGRAIKPTDKKNKHRSLSVSSGGKAVSKGGFNLASLDQHEEVLVTEAPIDVLTLVEMGYTGSLAVIGTGNGMVLSAVARRAKKVVLAFNADTAGAKATYKTIQFLARRDFLSGDYSNVEDLSRKFFRDVDSDIKDYNAWWISRNK